MDEVLAVLAGFYAWLSSQPTAVQAVVAVGIVLGLYPVLVVLRVLVAALYGAFRGLG
jgi:uncharacterized protein (DUF2062 family)